MSEPFEPALEQRLRRHVAALAGTPRPPGSDAHREARAYLRAHLAAPGFAVEEQAYTSAVGPGLNLLATPLPDRPALPLLIVGAHYDSRPQTPGADDNASAVAALLELAAHFGALRGEADGWSARLQFVAYDQEEDGLLGSHFHAGRVAGPVAGMLSLEMLGFTDRRPGGQRLPPQLIGVYPEVGDFIGVIGNDRSRPLAERVAAALRRVEGLPVEALVLPGNGEALPDARRSDHASFWDRGLPALMVTDTSFLRNPHYHQPTDTPDTLDYPFLTRVTVGVRLALEDLLRAPPPGRP